MKIRSLIFVLITALCNVVFANEGHPTNNLVRKISAEIRQAQKDISFYEYNLISVDQFKLMILDAFGEEKDHYKRLEFIMESEEFNGRIVNMYFAAFTYMHLAYLKRSQTQVADQIANYFIKGFEELLHVHLYPHTKERVHIATLKMLLPEYRRQSCSLFLD